MNGVPGPKSRPSVHASHGQPPQHDDDVVDQTIMVIDMVMTKMISAAEFKAKCLSVLDDVAESGQGVVVTKRGRPVARVVPMVQKPKRIVGSMKGEIQILGDIMSPLDVEWEAMRK